MSQLLMFYTDECDACEEMLPRVSRLLQEEGIEIEVRNAEDSENEQLLDQFDKGRRCGGVPFFYDTESERSLCGATSYEHLHRWATYQPE